ncbi:hypothetical protein B566_EDAN014270 [Ephemera danica]|nr:hypothetical protein B566_EDAN014270 [Ephemera danica]
MSSSSPAASPASVPGIHQPQQQQQNMFGVASMCTENYSVHGELCNERFQMPGGQNYLQPRCLRDHPPDTPSDRRRHAFDNKASKNRGTADTLGTP